jgi:hypothetical protein
VNYRLGIDEELVELLGHQSPVRTDFKFGLPVFFCESSFRSLHIVFSCLLHTVIFTNFTAYAMLSANYTKIGTKEYPCSFFIANIL